MIEHLLLGKHSYPCLMFTIIWLVSRAGTAVRNSEMKERKKGGREGRLERGKEANKLTEYMPSCQVAFLYSQSN